MADKMDDIAALDAAELKFVAELRAAVPVDTAAFDARVMAAVNREPTFGPPSHARRRRGFVAVSGVGLALAAVVAFVIIRGGDKPRETPASRPVAAARPVASTVRFTLVASGASRVAVAGSFNGWNTAATPLRRIDKDTWAADIPLGAGRYVYQFVIDGKRWVPDPHAPRDPGDDFGATNSVVTVAVSGSA